MDKLYKSTSDVGRSRFWVKKDELQRCTRFYRQLDE